MKITFSNRPPETVPWTPAQRRGDVAAVFRHTATVLTFVVLGSWSGAAIMLVSVGLVNDLLYLTKGATYLAIFFMWITVPWALWWSMIYWSLIGGVSKIRLLIFCEGWGIGQGMLITCLTREMLLKLTLIGIVAGLICYPVIWWIWRERKNAGVCKTN